MRSCSAVAMTCPPWRLRLGAMQHRPHANSCVLIQRKALLARTSPTGPASVAPVPIGRWTASSRPRSGLPPDPGLASLPREERGRQPCRPAPASSYQPPMPPGRPTRSPTGRRRRSGSTGTAGPHLRPRCRSLWPLVPGARLNTCHNAVDRHVAAGRGAQPAIIWDSPMTGRIETLTYARLLGRVSKLGRRAGPRAASARRPRGHLHADGPGGAVAMLACARLGAVHSVVFGGFAAARAGGAHRRCQAEGGRGGLLRARAGAGGRSTSRCWTPPSRCRRTSRMPCWCCSGQAVATLARAATRTWLSSRGGRRPAACVPVAATDPLYILYT